jgi:hypothetical protein
MSDIVEPRITGINKSIIDSYQNLGGINHITGPNLPSRRGVIAILEAFESLIFPGFQAEEKLEDDLIAYTIGAKTRRLVRELTIEISRSLEYAVRSEGRESVPGTCRKKAENIALDLLELIPSLRERAMETWRRPIRGILRQKVGMKSFFLTRDWRRWPATGWRMSSMPGTFL